MSGDNMAAAQLLRDNVLCKLLVKITLYTVRKGVLTKDASTCLCAVCKLCLLCMSTLPI